MGEATHIIVVLILIFNFNLNLKSKDVTEIRYCENKYELHSLCNYQKLMQSLRAKIDQKITQYVI